MGLKISHLDQKRAVGTLDGTLPLEVRRDGRTLKTRIAGWIHEKHDDAITCSGDMRRAVYAAVAKYRQLNRVL